MPFFRDLCSGIVGNFRNCMTTPLTRKKVLIISGIVLTLILLIVIIAVCVPSASPDAKGRDALNSVPFVEGNSDFKAYLTPNYIVSGYKYEEHFKETIIGAHVIATSVACEAQFKDVASQTFDQLDFLKRLVEASKFLKIAHSGQEIRANKVNNHRSIVLALGGGHSIDMRLSTLRSYFIQGVRLVSLASIDCSNPWAKSIIEGNANNSSDGDNFLKAVVAEMNRLGVAIDLAGSDKTVQTRVLDYSSAPVIYRGVGFSSQVKKDINLDDDILKKMKEKTGSLVMLSLDCSLFAKETGCSKKDFKAFLKVANSTLGVSNIAIGGLLYPNGVMPKDLGYADFPSLFDELKDDGWTVSELEGLAGNNFINYLQKVEEVAKKLTNRQPIEELFDFTRLNKTECYTPSLNPLQPTTQPSSTSNPSSQPSTASNPSSQPSTASNPSSQPSTTSIPSTPKSSISIRPINEALLLSILK